MKKSLIVVSSALGAVLIVIVSFAIFVGSVL